VAIRAVIFDLGHTLWDFRGRPLADDDGADAVERAARATLARAYEDLRATLCARLGRDDLPAADEFQRAVRDVLIEAAPTYFSDGPSLEQPPSHVWIDRGCRALGVELELELLREITPAVFATERERLYCAEGALEALTELHEAGYLLGCITNTLADTPTIRRMLRKHGFEPLMRTVVVSADEGWRKPHRSLFEKALRELDVAAHEAVFVGDSPTLDVAGAKAVGMWAVLTTQYATREYGEDDPQADGVIDDLRQLRGVVERLAADGGLEGGG
jgi:putative hydrolase of the HAD superfamily